MEQTLNRQCSFQIYLSYFPNSLQWHMAYDVEAYVGLLLIAIRPSDGKMKPGGSRGAFRKEQANAGISSLYIHHSYITP